MIVIALLLAALGFLLGSLHYVVDVPVPLISYLQLVGGTFVLIAGVFVPSIHVINGQKLFRQESYKWVISAGLLALGCVLMARGISGADYKNALNERQLNNLEQMKRAMEAYNAPYLSSPPNTPDGTSDSR